MTDPPLYTDTEREQLEPMIASGVVPNPCPLCCKLVRRWAH
jgi:hypothetical protein